MRGFEDLESKRVDRWRLKKLGGRMQRYLGSCDWTKKHDLERKYLPSK